MSLNSGKVAQEMPALEHGLMKPRQSALANGRMDEQTGKKENGSSNSNLIFDTTDGAWGSKCPALPPRDGQPQKKKRKKKKAKSQVSRIEANGSTTAR